MLAFALALLPIFVFVLSLSLSLARGAGLLSGIGSDCPQSSCPSLRSASCTGFNVLFQALRSKWESTNNVVGLMSAANIVKNIMCYGFRSWGGARHLNWSNSRNSQHGLHFCSDSATIGACHPNENQQRFRSIAALQRFRARSSACASVSRT